MQPEASIFQFLLPLNFAVFGGIFLAVYFRFREIRFAGWAGLAFVAGCLGATIEIFHPRINFEPFHFDDFTNSFYCLSSLLVVIALAERYRRPKPVLALGIFLAMGAIAQIYLSHIAPSLERRTIMIDLAAGSLIACSLIVIPWRSRRLIDRIILWLFIGVSTSYFARTFILVGVLGPGHVWSDTSHAVYVTILFFASALVGLSAGIALLFAAALDLLEKYKAASHTDPLTGLLNRRGLDELLERLGRETAASAFIVFDLDHFKAINDRFGHDAGDWVLRHVARMARDRFGGRGQIVRLGGEEFAVVVHPADEAAARRSAESLRRALARIDLGMLAIDLPVTASFGVAMMHAGESPADAIRRADRALYDAKAQGRNRVVYADPGSASPLLRAA